MSVPAEQVSPIEIHSIPAAGFNDWWPYISRHIEASDRGSDGVEYHIHLSMDWAMDKALAWVVIDNTQTNDWNKVIGALMTRIQDAPTGKILWVVALGGSRTDEWGADMMHRLREYAKQQECTRMRAQSVRKGIPKFLEQYGWHKVPVTVMEMQP